MSETDPAAVPAASGAGALLREAREQAGVHIASLAVTLKVPIARLEALEAERFDLLPGLPFVRALAGSVCRALKMDPAPVLARLPQTALPRLGADVARTDGATFRTTPAASANLAKLGGSARHPVVWVVGLLLLAAAALMLVPTERLSQWEQMLRDSRGAGTTQGPVGDVTDVAPVSNDPPVAAVAPMGPESSRTGAVDPVAGAVPGAGNAAPGAVGTAGDMPALQSSVSLSAQAQAAPAGLLSFSADADSWVRVSDSRGATVFEKVLKAGVPQATNGTPPLTVVVGNARATTVQVRGQPFDLSAITRNNVARFEVR